MLDLLSAAPLLTTKLHIPRARKALISRPRLLARLDEGFTRPLTLLVAPAGFGKTTLVGEWVGLRGRNVAWVSLDAGDNDPTRFWGYVIAALETLQPGVGEKAQALLDADQSATMEKTLTALINALAGLPGDYALVLDDYHAIENEQIHSALAFFLSRIPEQMHVFLLTRADPPMPLARWRARGDMMELRASDLRFNSEETADFLQVGMCLPLGADQVAALEARTEGWIAGLQLAALALQGHDADEMPDLIAAALSNNRFVIDYLVEEVLQRQGVPVQTFLRRIAILDRLSAPLCDAVTGGSDGQAMLDYLDRSSLFVVPLDTDRQWYRFHNLFGDVLRKRLGQSEPALVAELHHRASAWFEANGYAREAIVHALAQPDYERAALLIETVGMVTLRHGEMFTLIDWMKALPVAIVHARPKLSMYFAGLLAFGGEVDEVEPLLAAAERNLPHDVTQAEMNEFRGRVATTRAILAARLGDTLRTIQLTQEALDYLPADRIFLRGVTSWMRGLAYFLTGEMAEANRTFLDTIAVSQMAGNRQTTAMSLFILGVLEASQGHLRQARAHYERTIQLIEEWGSKPPPEAGVVYVSLGEVLRQQNELDAAETQINQAIRLTAGWTNGDALANALASLAWLRQARGDAEDASKTMDEALLVGEGKANAGTMALLACQRARLAIAQGDLVRAEHWAAVYANRSTVEPNPLPFRMGHNYELVTWALYLLASGRTGEAVASLERMLADRTIGRQYIDKTRPLILLALAYRAQGNLAEALAAMGEALALAAPEGSIRSFTDNGSGAVADLLQEGMRAGVWREPGVIAHVKRVLAVRTADPELASASRLGAESWSGAVLSASSVLPADGKGAVGEPLSQRELEVLRLVAVGLSNREIGDRLVVSLATVKSHLHSIFAKLGVGSRTQAAALARELQLL